MNNIHQLPALRIDLKQNNVVEAVCKQLDNIILEFILYDGCISANISNYNVELRAIKSDKVPLIQDTEIVVVENIVKIKANDQLTTTSGTVECELVFINKVTKEKKYSFNIELKVVKSVIEVNRSISKATSTLLERLENNLDQARNILDNVDKVKDEASKVEKDLINSETKAISINKELVNNTIIANKLEDNLKTTIIAATNTKDDLEDVNTAGLKTKLGLDNSIITAENSKNQLDKSISDSNKLKIELNDLNITATNSNKQLQETNNTALETESKLEMQITNADNKMKEIEKSTEDAIINKTNLDNSNEEAKKINEKLNITNSTANKTTENLQNENELANEKIEAMKKLDPNNVLTDVTDLKREVVGARRTYKDLNTRIDNIQARDGVIVYSGDEKPTHDGVWFDTSDNLETVEGNSVIKEIKNYINTTVKVDVDKNTEDIETNTSQLKEKANDIDNNRTTTVKDVTGAINELNSGMFKKTASPIPLTADILTLPLGQYFLEGAVSVNSNFPYTLEWTHATIEVIGTFQGADPRGYRVIRVSDVYGNVYENSQLWESNRWSGWNKLATTEEIDLTNTLRNGWQHGGCSFRAKKMGDELFVEGIIFNNLQSPNNILAQLSAPKDGRWHGGSAIGNNNTSLYLVLDPSGILTFQSNGHLKDILYTINIHYPI